MNVNLSILTVLIILSSLSVSQASPLNDSHSYKNPITLSVKNEEQPPSKEDSVKSPPPAIEEFEKEKLAKMKKNIGRRVLTIKTVNPAEFYESPNDLGRKLRIAREKEGFLIMEVVQNQSGTMNFYQVKFDTGQIGYLSADGNYLEIKIKEGSLISVPRRTSGKKKSSSQSQALASEAIELVKNHVTPAGSVEKRMMDEKAKSFPYPRWRYEAKEIGGKKFRVLQHVEERSAPPFVRTWIVDYSTNEIRPENLAAKEMYR